MHTLQTQVRDELPRILSYKDHQRIAAMRDVDFELSRDTASLGSSHEPGANSQRSEEVEVHEDDDDSKERGA